MEFIKFKNNKCLLKKLETFRFYNCLDCFLLNICMKFDTLSIELKKYYKKHNKLFENLLQFYYEGMNKNGKSN